MHFVLTTCFDIRATMSSQLRTACLQGASGWISNCQWNFHILESSCHSQGKKGSKAFRVWRNDKIWEYKHIDDVLVRIIYIGRGRKWVIHLELDFCLHYNSALSSTLQLIGLPSMSFCIRVQDSNMTAVSLLSTIRTFFWCICWSPTSECSGVWHMVFDCCSASVVLSSRDFFRSVAASWRARFNCHMNDRSNLVKNDEDWRNWLLLYGITKRVVQKM